MLDDRKLDVLRAIVQDYVATQEPVGSKALAERHNLGVSPATIRNDMAVLEEEGYITQPHTSAGRVPTDAGYRLFVDRLAGIKPLSTPERRAIQSFLDGAVDLDDVVGRTVRLLAQLTHQVAVVQYPSLTRSTIRHVELLTLAPTRVMLILITSTGRIEQRAMDVAAPIGEDLLADLRARINARVVGKRFADV
ncbi:MAG: heat-inducible transcription repressor HrcA, partial [Streptomycetaceae bacterium]|nr:heat-inducible transcription repressor HrcA [Streptomycetaceae bacterium]